MGLIKHYFEQYESAFMLKLNDAGLSDALARKFLSETALYISHFIKNSNLEKTIEILLSDDPAQLLSSINVENLAARLDMSTELVSSALVSISPVVSRVFSIKCNEIVEAAASLAWKPSRKSIGSTGTG